MAIAIGLLKMLLELQESRKTGALDIAGPAARVRLFIEEGYVVHADEGTVGETLGRLLVREHVLDQEQYIAAIERMAALRSAGKKAMLGEVFVDLGLLTEHQVHAALAAQVQSKAMRALGWPSARFRFMESPGPLVVTDRFLTPIEPLVVAALRLADRERVEALLEQARGRHAALRSDATTSVDAFGLQLAEHIFARGLDGTRTVSQLVEVKDSEGVDRAVILAALLLTDMLDLQSSPGARAPASPSRPPRPRRALGDSRRQRAAAPATISGSEPISAVPVGPETPVAPLAPLLAEKAYQSGKRLVRANRLVEAVVELRRAAGLYPAVEYDLWARWAESRADDKSEDSHADALRAVAELAIEEDTERGFATFVLGHLARRAGDSATADALFERARALDPEAVEDARQAKGGVTTLRGLAAAEALEAAMAREEEAERKAKAKAEANAEAEAKAEALARGVARARVAPRAEAVPAPAGRSWIIALIAIGGIGAAIFLARGTPGDPTPVTNPMIPSAVRGPSAAFTATASTSSAAVAPAASTPIIEEGTDASYAGIDGGLPSIGAARGVLLMPQSADSHRVYVDGRLAGVPPSPIVVGCGRHVVKIGSHGRDQNVDVPCGGSVSVPYP